MRSNVIFFVIVILLLGATDIIFNDSKEVNSIILTSKSKIVSASNSVKNFVLKRL